MSWHPSCCVVTTMTIPPNPDLMSNTRRTIKKKLEIYGATSWIFGDKDAGFSTSHEYIQGRTTFPSTRATTG